MRDYSGGSLADHAQVLDIHQKRDLENALQRTERNFTGLLLESEVRLFDEIEEVAVPVVHFNDVPAAGNGLGQAGNLGDQPLPALSLGSRTRS